MSWNSDLIRFLILAPILPVSVILFLLFRKRLHVHLWWFLSYLLVTIVTIPVGFVIYQSGDKVAYFLESWFGGVILITLAFMVILEVFRNVLADFKALQRLAAGFVILVGLGLFILAVYVGQFGAEGSDPMVASLLVMERSIRIVQLGLVIAIFGFVALFGLNWKNHIFGIALGYGLYAAVSMSLDAYVGHFGATVAYKAMLIEQFAYLSMLFIWVGYIVQPQPAKQTLFPASAHEDLQKWNEALAGFMRK
jgi:hypothetical protein